jgi:hypothetical protein
MPGPYFQKSSWASFTYKGVDYNLTHLDEYEISVTDSNQTKRAIVVTFSDHCFTRKSSAGDDLFLKFPNCSRTDGRFCFDRYHYSRDIRKHIAYVTEGKVWIVKNENYAIITTLSANGMEKKYGVFFSLERVTGISDVDLHMLVRSAYAADAQISTFGFVRFAKLVTLRMRGEKPTKLTTSRRKRP